MIKPISRNKAKITLITLLLFLGFLEPNCVIGLSGYAGNFWKYLHFTFLGARVCSISVAAVIFFNRPRFDRFFNLSVIIMTYIIIVDLANGNSDIIKTMLFAFSALAAIIILRYFRNLGRLVDVLNVICVILEIYIIINFILLIVKPDGIYHSFIYNRLETGGVGHFLGYKNTHIYFFLPYFFIKYYLVSLKENKINPRFILMNIIILLSSFLAEASTTVIIAVIILVLSFLPNVVNKMRSEWVLYVSLIISFLLIISDYLFGVLTIISSVFNKTASLSGRTTVWKQGINTFLSAPLFGTGLSRIPNNINYQQYHNKYLDFLCVGGVVLLILFLALLMIICKKANRDNYWNKNSIIIALIGYLLLFIVEASRTDLFFWIVMSVCFYADEKMNATGVKTKRPFRNSIRKR